MLNFPLFFGAMTILVTRTEGRRTKDWTKDLFKGLPKRFTIMYRISFFTIWLMSVYLMVPSLLGIDYLPNLGINEDAMFALIPAIFYLTSYGAYSSVIVERKKESQQEDDS